MDSIYNLNFPFANDIVNQIEQRISQHPGVFLLRAFLVSQEYVPLREGTNEYNEFVHYLVRSLEESNKFLEKNDKDVEGIFFNMAAHSYLTQLYAGNGNNLKAAGEAKNAYNYIKPGFDLIDKFPDFYFPSGLYNYYREEYPEIHPYFKAVVWLFRSGDKQLGLEMLKKGTENALFTRTESLFYLGHIYLRYENKPQMSLPYAEKLIHFYPRNLIFNILYVENLLRIKNYFKALPYIKLLRNSDKAFFRYTGEIFYGIYLEKTINDMKGAIDAYRRAENIAGEKEIRKPHFDSMLYLGLGRVNKKMGNSETATDFFRKAAQTAEFNAQKEEAAHYLE